MLAGWDHVCLRVESADETIAQLKRRGVTILREPFDVAPISHRIAFFSDPWGNIFELFEPLEGGRELESLRAMRRDVMQRVESPR